MKTVLHILFIGIILFLCSCGRDIVDRAQTGHYVYVNTMINPLVMVLEKKQEYNVNKLHQEYTINPGDSIGFTETELGATGPFASSGADSIIIRFNDNKCVSYMRKGGKLPDIGEGVFNLQNYKGFSKALLHQTKYRIVYEIDSIDYNKAVACP